MGGLKCKMCGSNLDIGDSITVCKCEKCGTSQTVPDIEDDKELKLFERAGRLRFNCDFDKAAGIYNTITDSYTEEAEGYWGLILCKYGIEYADNASGKKVPVCHRISYDSVMDDEDFELVMENSDSESRAIFREEAKIIEENRKKYIQIAESEQPYDIYISYRAKDDNGDKTAVSEIAGHLYNKLTSAGYSVFLSEAALKGKKQSDCEPYIYSALNSANVMLALGTSYDDYNDVWVKNEWNRYLEIAEKNKNKCLIPCYKDVDEYDIPKEFAGLKVCQLGNDDTFNNIMAEIANVVKLAEDKNAWCAGLADEDTFDKEECLKKVENAYANLKLELDMAKAVADADLVIESMAENEKDKIAFYEKLAPLLPDKTVVVTNSSTLLPSMFAKYTGRPDKYLSLHFANSIWKNNTAEVMTQAQTDEKYFNEVMQFANDIRMIGLPVRKEKSGYLLNSMLVPFLLSGLDLYAAGISDPESIDIAWTRGTGAPKGPFQIFDTVGLNTAYNIVHQYQSVPGIFSPLLKKMMMPYNFKKMEAILKKYIDEGKLGMSSGEGFYKYN